MTLLKLRPYQQDALDAIDEHLQSYDRIAVVLPTGAGKTVLFAHLVDKAHREGKRALVLVHREELAEQARDKIHSVAPHLTVGIVKAERNEIDADVIVGSVQTLANPRRRESLIGSIGMVICDEAHHVVARTWMEILADMGCWNGTPAVGFTATLDRTDGKGLADVWEVVAYERDILYMIDNGYLTDVRGQQVTVDGLDLATVAKSRGDYQEGQLGDALEASGAGEVIAQAYQEHASYDVYQDGKLDHLAYRQGVLFAPTVATAYSFAESLREHGISAETIEGTMSREDRNLVYKRYREGEIRVLSSVGVLLEGWDAPWAEVCVMARPTQSAVLFTQAVGRVLRPWPGKDEALVLDVVGVSGRHKLQSLTNLVHTEIRDGESYAEARARVAAEAEQRMKAPRSKLTGALAAKQVELFANSHSVWLQTRAGTWFVPVGGGVFFLWPNDDGTFRLGFKRDAWQAKKLIQAGHDILPNGWIDERLTMEYAMARGEMLAEEIDPTISQKDRSWRRTRPSQAQVDFALKLKAVGPEQALEMRKGALSDAISVAVASKLLDIG